MQWGSEMDWKVWSMILAAKASQHFDDVVFQQTVGQTAAGVNDSKTSGRRQKGLRRGGSEHNEQIGNIGAGWTSLRCQ
jgi:hypothetical protein